MWRNKKLLNGMLLLVPIPAPGSISIWIEMEVMMGFLNILPTKLLAEFLKIDKLE